MVDGNNLNSTLSGWHQIQVQ